MAKGNGKDIYVPIKPNMFGILDFCAVMDGIYETDEALQFDIIHAIQ